MNISNAARSSGLSIRMIRYYERVCALMPERTEAGYRDYTSGDVQVLRFIKQSRDLGFTVGEINQLLGLRRDPARASADVKLFAANHAKALRERIGILTEAAVELEALILACPGDGLPACPILDRLGEDSA